MELVEVTVYYLEMLAPSHRSVPAPRDGLSVDQVESPTVPYYRSMVAPVQITKLHGELLAFEWVEQDTGAVRASYRVTPSGMRSLKQTIHGTHEDEAEVIVEEPTPKIPRKKLVKKSEENTGEQATPDAA